MLLRVCNYDTRTDILSICHKLKIYLLGSSSTICNVPLIQCHQHRGRSNSAYMFRLLVYEMVYEIRYVQGMDLVSPIP